MVTTELQWHVRYEAAYIQGLEMARRADPAVDQVTASMMAQNNARTEMGSMGERAYLEAVQSGWRPERALAVLATFTAAPGLQPSPDVPEMDQPGGQAAERAEEPAP